MTDAPAWFRACLDHTTAFIGAVARPFSIIVTSLSTAVVPVVVVVRMAPDRLDLIAAAALVAALYAGVCGLYWGRAWENAKTGAHEVEKARVAQAPTGAGESPPGEKPPWERPA